MARLWDKEGVPHRGWRCTYVEDIGEDCVSSDEIDYESCEMCGHYPIRYVHVMKHEEQHEELRVGCVCAEKMEEDYINPKRRETAVKDKAKKRLGFIRRKWKISKKGNPYLKYEGHHVVLFPDKFHSGWWKYRLDGEFSESRYRSLEHSKSAAFNALWDT